MKKALPIVILVLLVAAAAVSYFSYSSYPDTPPSYYDASTIHHGATAPMSTYYDNGTRRTYVYEGIHPTGSRLMDSNGKLLEENFYQLSDKDGENVMVIAQTKYYTFWGQYHQIISFILLFSALAPLIYLILALAKKRGIAKA